MSECCTRQDACGMQLSSNFISFKSLGSCCTPCSRGICAHRGHKNAMLMESLLLQTLFTNQLIGVRMESPGFPQKPHNANPSSTYQVLCTALCSAFACAKKLSWNESSPAKADRPSTLSKPPLHTILTTTPRKRLVVQQRRKKH
eukprot:6363302-Amphidinium_carterae.1